MKLKKSIWVSLALLIGATSLTACGGDESDPTPTLKIAAGSPKSITFTVDNYTVAQEITLDSNVEWNHTAPSWLNIVKTGNKLSITASLAQVDRTGEIVISAFGVTTTIKIPVTQESSVVVFGTYPNALNLGRFIFDTMQISVRSPNSNWTVATESDWFTVEKVNQTVVVTTTSNLTQSVREGQLTITSGTDTYPIPVSQQEGLPAGNLDIESVVGTHTSSGTDFLPETAGFRSWTSTVTATTVDKNGLPVLRLSKFGGQNENNAIFIYVINGHPVIESNIFLKNDDIYGIQAFATLEDGKAYIEMYDAVLDWDADTKTISFPQIGPNGEAIYFGLFIFKKSNNEYQGITGGLFSDLQYTLDAAGQPVPQMSGNIQFFNPTSYMSVILPEGFNIENLKSYKR